MRRNRIVRLLIVAIMSLASSAVMAQAPVKHPSPGNPGYPFSEAVAYGGILYLSGEVGIGPDWKLVEGGIMAESKQTMDNIQAKLKRHSLDMSDIIKCTVFLADIDEWGDFNNVYRTYFSQGEFPARSALAASGLAIGARVEVECMAAMGGDN